MSEPSSPSVLSQTLARSRLGVGPVVFTVLAAAAPLTVVAGGATAGFAVTGLTGIALAYLVMAAILMIFSIGYVAMARQIVNAGAFYTYITQGLGKRSGVAASFVAVLGYNVMQVGLYGGFGVVLAAFIKEQFHTTLPWSVWALFGWMAIAWLGGRRIDLSGRVLAVLLIGEIAVALLFAAVQLAHPAGGEVSFTTLSPGNLFTGPVAAVAGATAIAGFVGFENTAVYSEETRDPQRTVPRATYFAVAFVGLIYGFCTWAMIVATGPDHIVERATAEGSELIFTLSAPYLPSFVITLGHLFFITSLFAAALSFHNTSARYHFALGREGVLPAVLGRTSPRTKAPLSGSLLQTIIGLAGIAAFAVFGWDPFLQMFFWLTVLGGFGVLILMVFTSIAVAAYFTRPRNRGSVGAIRGVIAPIVAAALLAVVLVATVAKFDVLTGVDPASPMRWILPGSFAVAGLLGFLRALYLKARRPTVYAAIGLGANRDTTVGNVATSTGARL
ncbi:APC family permease [Nucisporomicrobium flavum]|uniref:APC family permease n=1 Tax=Nucisporomicrobium flavum TaxID=2785915 RepID=UPI0018F4C2FB|nr:APC family permease [Nucisporomicrobium flavum]